MKVEEIVKQTKAYFGKNRRRLKKRVLSFSFNGKEYNVWKKKLNQFTSKPFDINYGMFDDVVEWLKQKDYSEIDWHWLGDLSWEFKFLLNSEVKKGYDWDKKLALKCDSGTARIVQVYVSDIVPCFVIDTYYMTYNKKENYYEFGPTQNLSDEESRFVKEIKKFFQNAGFIFLNEKTAMKKYKELYSDCSFDGNATLFDVLFSDTENYQKEIKRFNDKELKDPTGKKINWNEYYNQDHQLIKREEYVYYPSKNTVCVVTDKSDQIIEIKVWRDIDKKTHHEFAFDILKEYEKEKRQKERARKVIKKD